MVFFKYSLYKYSLYFDCLKLEDENLQQTILIIAFLKIEFQSPLDVYLKKHLLQPGRFFPAPFFTPFIEITTSKILEIDHQRN